MRLRRGSSRLLMVLMGAWLLSVAACGSLPTGKVPVDSPIRPWEAPDEDELTGEDDMSIDLDDAEEPTAAPAATRSEAAAPEAAAKAPASSGAAKAGKATGAK